MTVTAKAIVADDSVGEEQAGTWLLSGMVLGMLLKEQKNSAGLTGKFDVEMVIVDGNYTNQIVIDLPSGRYRLTIEKED